MSRPEGSRHCATTGQGMELIWAWSHYRSRHGTTTGFRHGATTGFRHGAQWGPGMAPQCGWGMAPQWGRGRTPLGDVEEAGGLVEEVHVGSLHQGEADGHPLQLAAAQLAQPPAADDHKQGSTGIRDQRKEVGWKGRSRSGHTCGVNARLLFVCLPPMACSSSAEHTASATPRSSLVMVSYRGRDHLVRVS